MGTGLVVAAFMATLEYTILYSQIARPYSLGLLFGLLMVNSWTKFIQGPDKKRHLHLAGFMLYGILCMYTHYFSFLLVILVGFSGLFFLKGKALREYLISGLVLVILFIPHFSFTLFDLHTGGLRGWLGEPNFHFIMDYFGYAFQYSIFNFLILGLFLIIGIYEAWKYKKTRQDQISEMGNHSSYSVSGVPIKRSITLHFFLWFILTFLIGFFYSKWRQPVLQYSSLLFVFPFFIMAVFSLKKIHRPVLQIFLVLLILGVNSFTLITKRKYYDLFYRSAYQEIIKKNIRETQKNTEKDFVFISDVPENIRSYYLKKYSPTTDLKYVDINQFSNKIEFKAWVDTLKVATLCYGTIHSSPSEFYSIIEDHFPVLVESEDYFLGNYYVFTGTSGSNNIMNRFQSENDFEIQGPYWSESKDKIHLDTLHISHNHVFQMDSITEFGPVFSLPIDTLPIQQGNQIDVKVLAFSRKKISHALLVITLETNQDILWWKASPAFDDYQIEGKWSPVYFSERVTKNLLNKGNLYLKVYIWNKEFENFEIDHFSVRIRKGNPVLYGLYEKI